ncbi:MAG: phosphate uptake regulator PhoU [Flavobacteriaceae bacterium]|nr:phosphate uptake regulator PhoU [Flavobacteriaceae bacterium]
MVTNKDATLKKINKEFLKISDLTLEQLEILCKILEQNDPNISTVVLKKLDKNELNINNLDIKLDNHIIKTIVLYQPLASELRHLFALYKIVQNSERIADRVIKIVRLKQKIKDVELYAKIAPKLNIIVLQTIKMVDNAIISFKKNDKELAFTIMKEDIIFDDLNRDLLKTAVNEIEYRSDIQILLLSMTDLRSIISSLDRIGDHAKNIAEATIYSIIGKNYMHQQIDENIE